VGENVAPLPTHTPISIRARYLDEWVRVVEVLLGHLVPRLVPIDAGIRHRIQLLPAVHEALAGAAAPE
jgi:hypothetical protein